MKKRSSDASAPWQGLDSGDILSQQLADDHGDSPDLSAQGAVTLFVQRSNHLPNAKRMVIVENVPFGGSRPTGAVDSIPRVIYHKSLNRLLVPKLLTDLCLPPVSRPAV